MKKLISFFAIAAIVGFMGCDLMEPGKMVGPGKEFIVVDPSNSVMDSTKTLEDWGRLLNPPHGENLKRVPTENGQGNDSSTPTVSVDGTTLVVNGNEYPRDPGVTINDSIVSNGNRKYVPGRIIVHFFDTDKAQVRATLDALGLEVIHTHTGYATFSFFLVSVPVLFEEQWKAALDDLGITAWVDGIVSLD